MRSVPDLHIFICVIKCTVECSVSMIVCRSWYCRQQCGDLVKKSMNQDHHQVNRSPALQMMPHLVTSHLTDNSSIHPTSTFGYCRHWLFSEQLTKVCGHIF